MGNEKRSTPVTEQTRLTALQTVGRIQKIYGEKEPRVLLGYAVITKELDAVREILGGDENDYFEKAVLETFDSLFSCVNNGECPLTIPLGFNMCENDDYYKNAISASLRQDWEMTSTNRRFIVGYADKPAIEIAKELTKGKPPEKRDHLDKNVMEEILKNVNRMITNVITANILANHY